MNGWYVAAGIMIYLVLAFAVGTMIGRHLKRRDGR